MRRLLIQAFLLAGVFASSGEAQDVRVIRIPVTGVVENGLAAFIARALRDAAAQGAAAAVLDINTPGGRVDAAERIVDAIRTAEIPVYAWVNPRAFSAGALIALATKGIFMQSGAVMGAATPVDAQGQKTPEKYVAAMRSEFRALAEAQGMDPAIAEGMVDETIDIPGVKPAGQLLSLSTGEAIKLGFARQEAGSLDEVLGAVGLEGAIVADAAPNWAEMVVRFLTSPLVSPLLLSLGMLGLIFEIKSGAFGLGGLISLGSLGLFFGSSLLLGLAGWEEVLLLGLGLIALGVEVFILPGFGIAGVLGLGLIGASTILAMVGAMPSTGDFIQAGAVLVGAVLLTGLVLFGWLRHLPTSTRWGGLFLKQATTRAEGFISAPSRSDLVGREGTASTDLRPSGTASFDGERLDVVTEGDFIKAGTVVRVIQSDGYRHVVRSA